MEEKREKKFKSRRKKCKNQKTHKIEEIYYCSQYM